MRDPAERFWKKVDKSHLSPGGCWMWTAASFEGGYGKFWLGNRNHYAHRISYFLAYSIQPGDFMVCHRCDNPACVNPVHLFLGDALSNMEDKVSKRRQTRGTAFPQSKLTEEQVLQIRSEYATNRYSQSQLAKKFDVSQQLISRVVLNEVWAHV